MTSYCWIQHPTHLGRFTCLTLSLMAQIIVFIWIRSGEVGDVHPPLQPKNETIELFAAAKREVISDGKIHVAHCIVGEMRSLTIPVVYTHMANFLREFSDNQTSYNVFMYVTLKRQGCAPNGSRVDLQPNDMKHIFDDVLAPSVVEFHDPKLDQEIFDSAKRTLCIPHCFFQWTKWKRCLDQVLSFEADNGVRFDWIYKSRADSLWGERPKVRVYNMKMDRVYTQNRSFSCGYGGIDHVFAVPRMHWKSFFSLTEQTCDDAHRTDLPTCRRTECFGCECLIATWLVQNGIPFEEEWSAGGYPAKWENIFPSCLPRNSLTVGA